MQRTMTPAPDNGDTKTVQRGQSLSEYALFMVIVGIALVVVANVLEPAIEDLFEEFADSAPMAPPSLAGYTPPPTYTPVVTNTPGPPPTSTSAPLHTATPTNTPTATATATATPTATKVPTVYVADIDDISTNPGGSSWAPEAEIQIVTSDAGPVNSALVSGYFDGTEWTTCVTDTSGWCSVSTSRGNGTKTVTFEVTNVNYSTYDYDPTENADPDGDSDGTEITLNRP